jgi:hypothetical protein
MDLILYEVTAEFEDSATADAWADWLLDKHISHVVLAGASSGRLVRWEAPTTLTAQYEFDSRQAFESYLRNHAPRLRAEGLERFGTDRVRYTRRVGTILRR